MATMLLITSTFKGKVVDQNVFTKDRIIIGRHESCDVVLDNPGISRQHAEIVRKGDGFVVRDLGSSNGTFVNKERVEEGHLSSGDTLQVGK